MTQSVFLVGSHRPAHRLRGSQTLPGNNSPLAIVVNPSQVRSVDELRAFLDELRLCVLQDPQFVQSMRAEAPRGAQ